MSRSDDSGEAVPPGREVSRRGALRGVALGGLTLPVLAACGSESDSDSSSETATAGTALATTADVPVGGGVILGEEKVVVTQPTQGDFKAFTAVCTHQSCLVSTVADGTIDCSCHGSSFSAEDGSVVDGPATSPLDEVGITVDGDQITIA